MAYKILIKYKSVQNRTYWEDHTIKQSDGSTVDFETDSLIELEQEINKIDQKYGYENIRVISDIDFNVMTDVEESVDMENVQIATSADINEIYNTAYAKVFSGGGD